MKRLALSILLQMASVSMQTVPAQCQTLTDRELASRLSAYLRPFDKTGSFSRTVLVARKGRVLFRRGYGNPSYELHVANSNQTRYHIASVSKPFTALAILQLQEQERLNLSDHISHLIPDFPSGDRITLENL